MEILLTRHGQTEWNFLQKVQGKADIKLNEKGIKQAKDVKDKLKNEYNLNLPRYITKVVKETAIDMEKGKARIREIEQELQEIENRIAIYRRELGL